MGRDNVVGIVTHYGLDGPGIESRWRTRIFAPLQTGNRTHPPSYTIDTRFFPWAKQPGRGVDYLPSSCTQVKGTVKLYICSPSGPSWPIPGLTLPFTFTKMVPCMEEPYNQTQQSSLLVESEFLTSLATAQIFQPVGRLIVAFYRGSKSAA